MAENDFTLVPDDDDTESPRPLARPIRVVSTGLHPTESRIPHTRGPDAPCLYQPCSCGTLVLQGCTDAGSWLAVEPQRQHYVVLFMPGMLTPRLVASPAYPAHWCGGGRREETL